MARFSGKIGYVEHVETSPSVWTEQVIERQYYGDLTRHSRKWGSSEGVNDNITFSQNISIVADPYLYDNAHNMRYVIFRGIKWKIKDFEINRPRVIISMGEEYHGDEA
jgi:hypothetical protein